MDQLKSIVLLLKTSMLVIFLVLAQNTKSNLKSKGLFSLGSQIKGTS